MLFLVEGLDSITRVLVLAESRLVHGFVKLGLAVPDSRCLALEDVNYKG